MYFGWVGSSFLGYVLGEQIQDPLKWGLDFAMPATFIGILIPQVRSRNIMNTVVSSAITATILKLILNNPIFILFGAIIGAFVGYKSERSGL
jgi:predicted branched-subunit amino acid permease